MGNIKESLVNNFLNGFIKKAGLTGEQKIIALSSLIGGAKGAFVGSDIKDKHGKGYTGAGALTGALVGGLAAKGALKGFDWGGKVTKLKDMNNVKGKLLH